MTPMRSLIATAALAVAIALPLFMSRTRTARADSDDYFPPVTDAKTKEECGACHMAFAPSMLPAESWRRLMAGLGDHFGEDASLDAKASQPITHYLAANAGDTGGAHWGRSALRGLGAGEAPLRITETPFWIREHRREVPERKWRDPRVGSKANCAACHRGADRGYYEDD